MKLDAFPAAVDECADAFGGMNLGATAMAAWPWRQADNTPYGLPVVVGPGRGGNARDRRRWRRAGR